jgi:hypothetical protein
MPVSRAVGRLLYGAAAIFFAAALALLVLYARPPGEPLPEETRVAVREAAEPYMDSGDLPGVTWVDDIHPIFVRNVCVFCHTRGREAVAEGLERFALGLVDPRDENNAYYSYHELVYAEGPPHMMRGETLRDGQCCWPRGHPPSEQRRIWTGHAERSALVRKLDRDYYDWRGPPRYFEEALRLDWGLPMPMYFKQRHEGVPEVHTERFEIRPWPERIVFRLSLWMGGGRDKLRQWPPMIPGRDRELIRYWINNSMQLREEGTGIEVLVTGPSGEPVKGAVVYLVGNYNSPERLEVSDELALRTDQEGKAVLRLPALSVVSSYWYAAAEKAGEPLTRTGYVALKIREGQTSKASVALP